MPRQPNQPLPGAPEPWASSSMPPFRARPPFVMSEMIAAEPAVAERLVRRLAKDVALDRVAGEIRETLDAGRPVVTTGCGTSEHAAMGIALLLSEALNLPAGQEVRVVQALEALRTPLASGLLLAVSHEGGTHATLEAMRAAQGAGATTALITVGAGSPAAALADHVIATEEQDQSWCHTVGYLAPLVAGMALAAKLRRSRLDAAAIRALLDVSQDAHGPAEIAAALVGTDRIIVAGAGPDAISARELALKISEGPRLAATGFELETVLHGHLAAVTRWTGLVVVLTDGSPAVLARAHKLLAAAKALSVPAAAIIGDEITGELDPNETPAGRVELPHTGRVPVLAGSLLASAIALQLLTERLARARSVNPDTLGRENEDQATAHG
jgi:glucosamine 6-phosphate synthetase-like amidotransferase/phosphosugar isomerase protein